MSTDFETPELPLTRELGGSERPGTPLDMTGPEYATAAPAVLHQPDSPDWVIVVRGADCRIWWTRRHGQDSDWAKWQVLGDVGVAVSAPSAYVGTDGSWWVAVLDTARRVRWIEGNAAGWAGWADLLPVERYPEVFDSRPGIAWTAQGGVYLVARKADCSVWWTAGSNSWRRVGPGRYVSAPALLAADPATLVVSAFGLDNSAFITSMTQQGNWTDPYALGGGLTLDPGAFFAPTAPPANRPANFVLGRGLDGFCWWTGAYVGGAWGGWQPMPGLAGETLAYGPVACFRKTERGTADTDVVWVDTSGTVRIL